MNPVRYISNESSGKQGYEIALALSKLGIKTTLISGPTNINFSKEIEVRKVISANDMMNEVKEMLPVDIAVCAAAVSDFRPKNISNSKIKKQTNELNNLKLKNNIDILDYLGKNNKNRPKMVVGFSAETENLIKNSLLKLKNKYCDLIVANDVSKKHTGLSVDYNKVSIIQKNGKIENIPRNKKSYIASLIAKKILDKFLVDDKNIN